MIHFMIAVSACVTAMLMQRFLRRRRTEQG